MSDLDPAWHLIPESQIKRVLDQDWCDIDPEFLGFTDVYLALAPLIPLHWTVVDLGCAYAPQAFIFAKHKAYIGVDVSGCEKFAAPNTTHYTMRIAEFIEKHSGSLDLSTTFTICSFVPSRDSAEQARNVFPNIFTYYPAGTSPIILGRAG